MQSLLIPEDRAVEVWPSLEVGAETHQRIAPASSLSGDPLLQGLAIDLEAIWSA